MAEEVNVQYLIIRAIKKFPDRTALVRGSESLAFHEIGERTNRLGNALLDLSRHKGDSWHAVAQQSMVSRTPGVSCG